MSPSMLIVGLDPALVDDAPSSRAAFPEIDAEAVRAGVAAGRARLKELGFAVDVCPLDYGRTAGRSTAPRCPGRTTTSW